MKRLLFPLLIAALASLSAGSLGRAAGTVRCVGGPSCYPTLAAALAAANDGDTVRLGPGTYAGGVAIVHSITLQGAGAERTIISGGGPVVTIGTFHGAAEPTVSIIGVTITGGLTTSSFGTGGSRAAGGGVQIPPNAACTGGATVTIANSVISNNTAASSSGGSDVAPCPGSPTHFSLAEGGGIYNAGQLTLLSSTVSGNTAGGPNTSNAWGGGILSTPQGGSLTLLNSTVSGNEVTVVDPNGVQATGGGILAQTGNFVVRNSAITGNRATLMSAKGAVDGVFQANGAGIQCDQAASIVNSRIDGNLVTASDPNGEPAAYDSGLGCGGNVTMQNSSVSGNRVVANVADTTDSGPDGTALELDDASTVSNTIVAGNSVTVTTTSGVAGAQGAVLNFAPDPGNPTTFTNSVVKDNTMTVINPGGGTTVQGGGIANSGALALRNVQITGNRGTANGSSGFAQGAGLWNGTLFGSDPTLLTLDRTAVTGNTLSGGSGVSKQGAGVYSLGFAVSLSQSVVTRNSPDNCYGLTC